MTQGTEGYEHRELEDKGKVMEEEQMMRSPLKLAWVRLKRHRMAYYGGIVLAIMYFSVILAPFYAPHAPTDLYRQKSYHPPVKINIRCDETGSLTWPYIYNYQRGNRFMVYGYKDEVDPMTGEIREVELDLGTFDELDRTRAFERAEEIAAEAGVDDFQYFPVMRVWVEDKEKSPRYPLTFFTRGEKEYTFLGIKSDFKIFGLGEPTFEDPYIAADSARLFLFGSDQFGRCTFSRILYGGRVSLFIGFGAIMISTAIGMLFGGLSGFYGGWVDNLMMRIAEVFMAFPAFYLLMALTAVLPLEMAPATRFFMITLILALVGWGGLARVIRGMVLSIRQQDFSEAARALGASDLRIVVKHILPNTLTYVIVAATISIPSFILMEAGLSFIGLGIQEPQPSWGNMLSAAQQIRVLEQHPWLLIPGFFIFVGVLAFSLLGDGIRDAFDPRSNLS